MPDSSRYVVGSRLRNALRARRRRARRDGEELGDAEHPYPHAVMSEQLAATGAPLGPNWALQDPDDYIEVLREAVPAAVAAAGIDPAAVVGIATDFTACTVLPVLGRRHAAVPRAAWRAHPHAWVKLWRHHAAQPQADRVTDVAAARGEPWLRRYGGRISSEWEFAKALQILEEDPGVYGAMDRFVEAADWIVWQLCGVELRNACTAGYKGIYQDGRYPSEDYLAALNPAFARFAAEKLSPALAQLGARAGSLTAQAAAWTGLREGIAVAVGNVDAHVTAPAAGVTEPGRMVAIMGTSTCHVMVGEAARRGARDVRRRRRRHRRRPLGLRGRAERRRRHLRLVRRQAVPPAYHEQARALGIGVHEHLTALGAAAGGRRARPGRARLVERQPLRAGRSRAERRARRHDPRHPPARDLPRADRGDRVRRAQDHRHLRRRGRAGARVHRRRRPVAERAADAVLRRRDRAADQRDRLRAGAGARLGAARRGRRRRARRHLRRGAGDGEAARATSTRPTRRAPQAYDELYALYGSLHDHFGREQRSLMRTLQAIRERAARGARALSALAELRRSVAELHGELTRTAWSPGRAATSRRACRARSCS
jgi:L-ribulokinase